MAKQPRIRFKGYTEEWKDQRLGDIGKAISGIGFPEDSQGGKFGVPFYKVSDLSNVGNEFVMQNANNYVSEEQIKRHGWKPVTQLPAIMFAKVGAAVFLNRKRLVLSPSLCDNNTMLFALKPNACETYFAKYLFDNIYLPSLVQIGTLPSYNGSQVEDIVVYLPKPDEQKRISACLNELTATISKRETELEKLKNIKRALLEKLFPQDGQSTPAIRFKGFEGKWESKVLGNEIEETGTKNRNNLPLESYSITNDAGFIPQTEKFENGGYVADADKTMYTIVPPKSFAYNPARINVGSIGYYNGTKDVIVSSLYIVFKTSEAIHDDFLMAWFKSDIFNHLIYTLQEGGVRQYFFYDKMVQCPILLPKTTEQEKIAKLVNSLNKTISLRERQLTLLKHSKQALLEQMFVNN